MTTIAQRMRAAAASQDLHAVTIKATDPSHAEQLFFCARRLRADADEIEAVMNEMDDQYGWLPSAQAAKWADRIRGEVR